MKKEDFEEIDADTETILDRIAPAKGHIQEEGWDSWVQQQSLLERGYPRP